MFIEYYLYYLYYTFLGYPFIIRVVVVGISFFIPFFIIALLSLIDKRIWHYRKKKLQEKLRREYWDKIKNIITSKEAYSLANIEKKLNYNVKKLTSRQKRLVTNNILYIHDKEEYVNKENYLRVINYFNIRQFWENKLKHGSLASRQRALRKLDDLDIEIPGSVITSLTYNSNQYLRKRARSSYMYFSKNSPFKFFNENFDKTFNDWDKVEIHRMLSRRRERGENLPNLTQWIKNSDNSEFQCFLVDEIRHFKQDKSTLFLLKMVETQDLKLRKHCIKALGEMKFFEAEKTLIYNYALQPHSVQKAIVVAIQKMNTGKALRFLEEAYNNAHDIENRIIVLKAIFNYGKSGRLLFDSMKKKSEGFSLLVFEHVSNPLIKHNLSEY